jgi:F0F1-type ATP synthase assembly protein I
VEQFVADLAQADQVIQMVEFVSSVFVGAVVGLQV